LTRRLRFCGSGNFSPVSRLKSAVLIGFEISGDRIQQAWRLASIYTPFSPQIS
jgi:tRNA/tmRNA/rRNA uracil-C5-methylase (TrmA/RlmC/RlmD family)